MNSRETYGNDSKIPVASCLPCAFNVKECELQSLSQSSKNLTVETAFWMGNEYGLRPSFQSVGAGKILGDFKKFTDQTFPKALCESRVLGLKTLLESHVQSTI
jgi:hypothetical protein